MAEKTPTSVTRINRGNVNTIVALFDGTVSSNDIDDNDTWTSGITNMVGWPRVVTTIDGPQDCCVDAYTRSTGQFTFGSAANQTAYVYIDVAG